MQPATGNRRWSSPRWVQPLPSTGSCFGWTASMKQMTSFSPSLFFSSSYLARCTQTLGCRIAGGVCGDPDKPHRHSPTPSVAPPRAGNASRAALLFPQGRVIIGTNGQTGSSSGCCGFTTISLPTLASRPVSDFLTHKPVGLKQMPSVFAYLIDSVTTVMRIENGSH